MTTSRCLVRYCFNVVFAFGTFAAGELHPQTPAYAQQSQQWILCRGKDGPTVEQRIAACTAIIDAATETPSGLAEAHGFLGVAYDNRGDTERAVQEYNRAISLDPASGSSHRYRGNKYKLEKDYDHAIFEYTEALRLNPSDSLSLSNRGIAHTNKRDYSLALTDFDEAIHLDPTLANAFIGRGIVFRAKGENEKALADFNRAISLQKNFAVLYLHRCAVRSVLNQDLNLAISDCDEALRIIPNYSFALVDRAYIFLKVGEIAHSIADFDTVLQRQPNNAYALYGRGLAKEKAGDDLAAKNDFAAAYKAGQNLSESVERRFGVK